MESFIGKDIGKYHIVEQFEGGMAVVYKAFDTALERYVAIKFIRKEKIGEQFYSQVLQRFEREAKVLASLDHPNIVAVYDSGEFQGSPFLVEKFVPGGALHSEGQPMPYAQAARLLAPVARALEYAHRRGIIHRDVKPDNILLSETGVPMLSDFGIAKILEAGEDIRLTAGDTAIGTPAYMAPEQWQGNPVAQSDIYALGVVLYELVTGRLPYSADTPGAVMIKQATEPLPRPRQFVHDLPDDLEGTLFKALALKPENRFASMGEFAAVLERLAPADSSMMPAPLAQPALSSAESISDEKARRASAAREADELKRRQASEEKVRRLAARLAAQEKEQQAGQAGGRVERGSPSPGDSTGLRARPIRWPIWLAGGVALLGVISLVAWLVLSGTGAMNRFFPAAAIPTASLAAATPAQVETPQPTQTAVAVETATLAATFTPHATLVASSPTHTVTSTGTETLTPVPTATVTETAKSIATSTPQPTLIVGPPDLSAPGYFGIAVDQNYNIYVTDTNNHRIRKFSNDGRLIMDWGTNGNGRGLFIYPHGITVDVDGYLIVADAGNHRIQTFSADGTFRNDWGSQGTTAGKFDTPLGTTVDGQDRVFIADTNNHRVQVFDYPGLFVRQWGGNGSTEGKFNYPQGIAVNRSGHVFVADTGNYRIQEFNASGGFIRQWGGSGSKNGQFLNPQSIAVDRNGNIYVADTGNHRIQKFNFAGGYLTQWGSLGKDKGQFSSPTGIAFDLSGNVYVTDADSHRVQVFDSNGKFLSQWGE